MIERFSVDDDEDLERASDGVSRFGAYITERLGQFLADYPEHIDAGLLDTSCDDWLMWTWRVATPPVMVPGYATRPSSVLSAELYRDDWDGALAASVEVATATSRGLGSSWRGWDFDAYSGRPERPGRGQEALTVVTLNAPLTGMWASEPVPVDEPHRIVHAAQGAVAQTARRLTDTFAAAITNLAGGGARGR